MEEIKPRQVEVIRCHCGGTIAGRVMGLGPGGADEWAKDIEHYKALGYTVEVVPSGQARLDGCRCAKVIAASRLLIEKLAAELMLTNMGYTDAELQQLVACETGMGEIGPEYAKRLIRVRALYAEANAFLKP